MCRRAIQERWNGPTPAVEPPTRWANRVHAVDLRFELACLLLLDTIADHCPPPVFE
jgi:hypothetical protein